ncbi:hypothetical protein SAMN05216241_12014 [Limimonas halophila]|uniref:Uncharacterized protein n=1 Tax=Limimonas halophila TaxID=1082479 RepID=A0A1G7V479_9PROT|nr:ELM1/GtrOC1 family putative glycosyltransferase [Limimonas halophila]SDG54368.1 hypothetical protein SAMN05216241_12014 [Limimonas halophila]
MAGPHQARPQVVRDHPDRIVLPPDPGVEPDPRPPVRIFLGTEDGQDRAERIFVHSVACARNPARTYEIHLMKNLAGFDRRRWRTGFTLYRYAIPDLAGRSGRAIYNDVDQIYLTDPAELFDLPMTGHGYLAVSPRDTSVMLLDCEAMAGVWNREAAARGTKRSLINAAVEAGHAGPLDPGWNARDDELREGESKVVHYTELNRQPWRPFPGQYTYHPNPWGMVWHRLERDADARGFELFGPGAPSQHFTRFAREAAAQDAGDPTLTRASQAAHTRVADAGVERLVRVHAGGDSGAPELPAEHVESMDATATADWPRGDAVAAVNLLDRAPPDDVPWLIAETFRHADALAYFAVRADRARARVEPHGVRRTAAWYRERIARVAHRFPDVSWVLDTVERGSGRAAPTEVYAADAPGASRHAWLLQENGADPDPMRALAAEMGWTVTETSAAPATAGDGGWPDVVLSTGKVGARAARHVQARAGNGTRLIHLGQPHADVSAFDLVLTTAADRLPLFPTVAYLPLPPTTWTRAGLDDAAARACNRLGDAPRPWVVWWADGSAESDRPVEAHARARAESLGGTALCATPADGTDLDPESNGAARPDRGIVGAADRLVVAAGGPERLARACASGQPVEIVPVPGAGGGTSLPARFHRWLSHRLSHRGTPLQQTPVERTGDRLIAHGLVTPRRDPLRVDQDAHILGLATLVGRDDPPALHASADQRAWAARAARRMLGAGRRVTG